MLCMGSTMKDEARKSETLISFYIGFVNWTKRMVVYLKYCATSSQKQTVC